MKPWEREVARKEEGEPSKATPRPDPGAELGDEALPRHLTERLHGTKTEPSKIQKDLKREPGTVRALQLSSSPRGST